MPNNRVKFESKRARLHLLTSFSLSLRLVFINLLLSILHHVQTSLVDLSLMMIPRQLICLLDSINDYSIRIRIVKVYEFSNSHVSDFIRHFLEQSILTHLNACDCDLVLTFETTEASFAYRQKKGESVRGLASQLLLMKHRELGSIIRSRTIQVFVVRLPRRSRGSETRLRVSFGRGCSLLQQDRLFQSCLHLTNPSIFLSISNQTIDSSHIHSHSRSRAANTAWICSSGMEGPGGT